MWEGMKRRRRRCGESLTDGGRGAEIQFTCVDPIQGCQDKQTNTQQATYGTYSEIETDWLRIDPTDTIDVGNSA